ncbi:NAC transcription factor 29-like protein [Cinnamomum micranthum f. kanehirae]|uniref:NAC transcription factor 29-like protein n=1 Tax=Cinnamomum micranthum f. kanehirae TaxID=337451 RepID=A0A3S3MEN7_9MAGN|nr:NAC transcription factor 29-like protein [Cinnamomum micranthum f. kanehirae]
MGNESSSLWSPGIDLEYVKKNLPPGFRFEPTDYELLAYLRWKKEGHPIANIINEIPQDKCFPDELKREFSNRNEDGWYFFIKTKQHSGNRVDRRAGNGTWKSGTGATGITHGRKTVGYKTTLTFAYIQKGNKAKKTIWNMHEYRLPHQNGKRKGGDNLVLCKIYKRRVRGKTYDDALDEENTSISSIANNKTEVSNGSEHMLSDVSSTKSVEINHESSELPNEVDKCLKWINGFLMGEEIGDVPEEELNRLEGGIENDLRSIK